jgi:hypothetical protein
LVGWLFLFLSSSFGEEHFRVEQQHKSTPPTTTTDGVRGEIDSRKGKLRLKQSFGLGVELD